MSHLKRLSLLAPILLSLFLTSCFAPKSEIDKWADQIALHHAQSEGGQMIAESINAHGGLRQWLENEVLEFRWTYHMNDRGPDAVTSTLQRVDTSSFEAVHEVTDADVRFGWTGQEAWITPDDAPQGPNPRFWSLTPYYFVGIPFVFADINANFEKLTEGIDFEGTVYDQVKVTFNPGTGDAPDDYYIVLIHPETKLVGGTRYIVTSPIVARNGPGPEKLITLENYIEHKGVQLPTRHRSFTMDGDKPGKHIRDAEAEEYQWLKRAEVDFSIPEGATRL